jgi:hypothetical protein
VNVADPVTNQIASKGKPCMVFGYERIVQPVMSNFAVWQAVVPGKPKLVRVLDRLLAWSLHLSSANST